MTLQEILASLLNPNGSQQAQPMMGAPAQVGDHANPAALMQAQQRLAQPPQMPQQQAFAPQALRGQPMPQSAQQAAPQGGGLGAIGGILQNIIAPQSAQKNKTVGWLTSQGLDPGTATVLASDKGALRSYILSRSQGKESEFDQRARAAQQYNLDPSTPEGRNFILTGNLPEARGGAAEMSLNTIPVMVDGKAGLLQVDKAGKGHVTELPPGTSIAKAPMIKDTGTEFQVIDPVTREVVQTIPKNVAGAAAQTELGKSQGAAAFDLPRVEQNANQTLSVLERMKTHKGREGSTGFIQGLLPARNSDQVDFQSLVDQTQGQAFLQAFQMLKGAGQITEIEGTKATDAISRLRNQRLGDQDYLQAINDLEGVIKTGLERARVQARGGSTPSGSSAPQSHSAPDTAPTKPPPTYDGDPKLWQYMTPEQRKLWQ